VDEDCISLTSYFREGRRADGMPVAHALIDMYSREEVTASILLRGAEGFGRDQQPHAGRSLPLTEARPLTATAVSTRPSVKAVLGQTLRLTRPGLVTVERGRLLTGDIDPAWVGQTPGEATKLTVYLGSQDRVYQIPAFEAVCGLLYRRGIAGATVLSGIDGTARGRRERAQFLRRDADAPLEVIAVGHGDQIAMVLPELGMLFRHPVMTVEKVRICKRDGKLISRPQVRPATGELAGMAARLKLTVYTSGAARHDAQPVHRVIVRQLRLAGISGAITVRGMWGFRADHEPHGGHFPHLGRHVPAVTTVIDAPERIAAAFDVIDALTDQRGLVTTETVLAAEPADDDVRGLAE
jgi:PII-like signaling protein